MSSQEEVLKTLKPSGWAGSSLHEIRLCKNGNVLCVCYDGAGNTPKNFCHTELIAQNAETIEAESIGQCPAAYIIVKGKNLSIVNDSNGWIKFRK